MKTLLAAALLSLLSAPAFADPCLSLAEAAREALAGSDVDGGSRAAIRGMIEEALRLHDQGRHAAARETLQTAMMMLGLM